VVPAAAVPAVVVAPAVPVVVPAVAAPVELPAEEVPDAEVDAATVPPNATTLVPNAVV